MIRHTDQLAIEAEGFTAFQDQLPKTSNPYPANSTPATWWENGYRGASIVLGRRPRRRG